MDFSTGSEIRIDVGTIAPPEGEGVSAKTVSERGRQPRSLTDYNVNEQVY
jgi:hypothetical protein